MPHELLDRLDEIHVLDLNAGGMLSRRTETEDGFETQFQANHLGHFLLSQLLLDRLRQSAPARIVVLSSWGHTQARGGLDFDDLQWVARPYRGSLVYSATKLMNLYFTFELARRLADTDVTVNAMHPGYVASGFAMGGDTDVAAPRDHGEPTLRPLPREGGTDRRLVGGVRRG